jgi:hypothetical protein
MRLLKVLEWIWMAWQAEAPRAAKRGWIIGDFWHINCKFGRPLNFSPYSRRTGAWCGWWCCNVWHNVRLLISGKSFLLTHCPQIYIRKEISRPGFLDVSRYSVVHSIDLRRVFLCYVNISMCKFEDSVSCPGQNCMGRISHINLKNRMVILQNRNFEKSHRTTGPRLDLRPDLWSWANSGLDSTFGNVETGSFWVTTRGTWANGQ